MKVRFDPTLNHYCIVSDIHVITDVSSCPTHPLNGVQFNGVIVFGTMNPQMEFDVPKGAVWFEITANIEWYSGAEIEKVFTAVQDLPKLKQMEGCQTLINGCPPPPRRRAFFQSPYPFCFLPLPHLSLITPARLCYTILVRRDSDANAIYVLWYYHSDV